MKKFNFFLSTLLLCLFTSGFVFAQAPIAIGNEFDVDESTNHPYCQCKTGVVYEKEFFNEGSAYVKIYFSNFDLAEGDYVEVFSPDTDDYAVYTGNGKAVNEEGKVINEFWSSSIWSDRAVVRLISNNVRVSNYGFDIKKVAYGFTPAEIEEKFATSLKSICGSDDKEWAKCYEGTAMYEKAKAVSRLYINGSSACTGWLIGSEGHLMTNEHCIETNSDAYNTEYEFMGEGSSCQTQCSGWFSCRGTIEARTGSVVKLNANLDYALIKLSGNLSSKYGYLSFRSAAPSIGERIYIPQHPGGKGKQISVWDDRANDYASVESFDNWGDVEYFADTEGGSSGSPVLAYSDNLVIALHHYGGCKNSGVMNTDIINDLGSLMPANGVRGGSTPEPSCSDGIQNGDEQGIDCGGSCPNSCGGGQSGNCPSSHPYYACSQCWENRAQAESGGCYESTESAEMINNEFSAYPNPVRDNLHINGIVDGEKYIIINLLGNAVKEGMSNVLDVSELNSGIYILKTTGGRQLKFIKN